MKWQTKQENWTLYCQLCIFTGLKSQFSLLSISVAVLMFLAAVLGCGQALDRTLILSNERSSIERTYELTKYLDHQLKEIRDTYVSHNLLVCVRACVCVIGV